MNKLHNTIGISLGIKNLVISAPSCPSLTLSQVSNSGDSQSERRFGITWKHTIREEECVSEHPVLDSCKARPESVHG